MNLRQSYEQLIAGKLRQLHPPDADASWQQMKRLLDDDEDTRVGGRKRPPGNRGWWRIGILAIVLSASFWLYVEKTPAAGVSLSKNNMDASPQADNKTAETNKAINSVKTQTATIDNTTTLNDSTINTPAADKALTSDATADKSIAAVAVKNKILPAVKTTDTDKATAIAHNPRVITLNNTITATTSSVKNNTTAKNTDNKIKTRANKDLNAGTGIAGAGSPGTETFASERYTYKIKPGYSKVNNNNNTPDNDNNENNSIAGNNYSLVNQPVSEREKTWFERLTELKTPAPHPSYNTSLSAGDSIANPRDVSNVLNNETKKEVVKAQRDKAIALLDKKDKKSLHLNLSNLFKPFSMHVDAEPWWAAGIALNGAITVNAQNRFNYNMNAKSNTLSDYIPSPYLQFHLNNYVYLQTELNFVTPQYTPQLLIYRQNNDITAQAGMSHQKSIYIQKMYYFNWPVSLHYSPISNLYFSAGLQFSSFQSGLAAIEEKEYTTALGPDHSSGLSSRLLKFKDDSIAAKIAPNEWRWQAGAEYYWNRFSVGLRYNQSFKNAINTVASPSLPATIHRNESLLFFVRYNLFESRSKNSAPKNQ